MCVYMCVCARVRVCARGCARVRVCVRSRYQMLEHLGQGRVGIVDVLPGIPAPPARVSEWNQRKSLNNSGQVKWFVHWNLSETFTIRDL